MRAGEDCALKGTECSVDEGRRHEESSLQLELLQKVIVVSQFYLPTHQVSKRTKNGQTKKNSLIKVIN